MAQGSPPRPSGTIHISLVTLIIEIPRPIHIWCVKTSAVLMSSPVQIKALSAISGFGGITSNPYHRILEGVTFHIYSSLNDQRIPVPTRVKTGAVLMISPVQRNRQVQIQI